LLVTVSEDIVAVDPASLDVIDVVIHHERIHCVDELEVPQIWEQIWLHNSELHRESFTHSACF